MNSLVFVHEGRAWRVSLDGDEVTLRHGIDEITFTNVDDLMEEILEHITKEKMKMKKYDYNEMMENDILEAIREYMAWEKVTVEDLDVDTLREHLWVDDSVTGNASGSYTMSTALAKQYVLDNEELQAEAIQMFGLDSDTIADKMHDWEYWDVTIRCYLLDEVLHDVVEALQEER